MGGPVLPRQVQEEEGKEMSSGSRCPCHDTLVVKNLNRWFKEKWVDVSRKDKDGKHPPCGRSKAKTSSKGYPKCRPSVKVSSDTPKTSRSMTTGQKRAATKRKRSKKQGVGGKPTIVKEQTTLANHMGLTEEEFRRRAEAQGTVGNLYNMPSTDAITGEVVQPRKIPKLTTPTDSRDTTQTSLDRFDKMDLAFQLIKEDDPLQHVETFLDQLTPDDTGVQRIGDHTVHFEGFTDMCNQSITPDCPAEQLHQEAWDDFDKRQGEEPILRDKWGTEENPTVYSVYHTPQEDVKTGEPMEIAFQLLKERKSPEAMRRKLEYDKRYEKTPERRVAVR